MAEYRTPLPHMMAGLIEAGVNRVLALDPESADAMSLYGLGSEIRQLRIQAFERAIELDPGHHRSFYRFAMEMKKAGELHVAEQLIRQALLFAPQDRRYREALKEIIDRRDRASLLRPA